MRSLLIDRAGQARLGALAVPEPGSEDVLLRIRTIGFCGSDLNTYRGLNPLVTYPRVPGHEIAAEIVALGDDVPDGLLTAGMHVTVYPYTSCGTCPACRRGRTNACRDNQTLGVQRDGALTELIAVPWRKVVRADGLSLRELALVEPLSVGFHAVTRGRVASGDVVVVIGCGAVGLGAVAGAHALGAHVVAVDVDDAKLALAQAAGARDLVNSPASSLRDRIAALTSGDRADVVIEAVGLAETFVAAVEAVAFTGRVVYIGYTKGAVAYDTSLFVKKELDILGSRNATLDDFRDVSEMLRRGTFPTDGAVTRSVSLEGAAEALEEWHRDPRVVTRIHVDVS
ncbi:MAG: zinc-binding alcohol dehydrogenase family protein [Gemmatimonadota bacterium]|nr:zinc-binding alcohol dehydrogenase family protein [Gemmatimonadota bacterium]